VASRVVRIASVVRPYSTPAARASASPCNWPALLWPKLSLKASTTPEQRAAAYQAMNIRDDG